MTLYEIDQSILALIDPETGEVTDTDRLSALDMERTEKLENVACWIKNLSAESAALKMEIDALAERKKRADRRAESLKGYLLKALDGVPFETPRCAVSFRKSKKVEYEDVGAVANWCVETGNDDLVTYSMPTVEKSAIKKLLNAGQEIPGAKIVESLNMGVK